MDDLEQTLKGNTLAIPAFCTIVGVLLSYPAGLSINVGLLMVVLAAGLYVCLVYFSKDPITTYRLRMMHYVWLAIGFFGVGIFFGGLNRPDKPNLAHDEEYDIICEIEDVSEKTSGENLIMTIFQTAKTSGEKREYNNLKALAIIRNSEVQVEPGDILRLNGQISVIKNDLNTFNSNSIKFLNSKGIYYNCKINDGSIKIISHRNSLKYLAYRTRAKIEEKIEKSSLSTDTRKFLITVLLGDRTYLDSSTRGLFADAGVAHVLALSGMHMGIIGGIFLFLLFPINFAGKYKLRLLLSACLLWGYAFITGMAPSTVRACVMVSFVAIAIALERKRSVFNSMYAALLVILLSTPSALYDAGFQLSFACVFSLAIFASHLNKVDHRHNPRTYSVVSLLIATITATFGSWVLTAYYFNYFPLAFLPANILLLPLLPIYIVAALIYLMFASMGCEISILGRLLDFTYVGICKFLEWIGSGAVISVDVSFEMVVIWFMGIALLGLYINTARWRPFLITGVACLLITCGLLPLYKNSIPEDSFIITENSKEIVLNVRKQRGEKSIVMPRRAVSRVLIGESNIIVVDSDVKNEKLSPADYKCLIIGGRYKGGLEDIYNLIKPQIVVLHRSIGKKREQELLNEAAECGIPCHSVRLQQPYRFILSDAVD